MVWLVTHIWLFIGLAALFGLILGWAVRGIRVSGGARRAVVERNIALTELDQVRAELDSLYTAQRGQGGDEQPNEALQAREARISDLEAALTAAQEEVATVKADGEKKLLAAATASAAAVGAGAVFASGQAGKDETSGERLDASVNAGNAQLEWRNRYLESRVRSLESVADADTSREPELPIVEDMTDRVAELEAGNEALQSQITSLEQALADERSRDQGLVSGLTGAVAGAGAALVGQDMLTDGEGTEEAAEDTVAREKLAWQNDYLRQRLAFMEEHGLSETSRTNRIDSADAGLAAAVQVPDEQERGAVAEVETATDDALNPGDIEQELARLRWRNRYLEGRLAYIDGDASVQDGADVTEVDDAKQSAAEALLERLERSEISDT